ncbi:oligosaccharide flippase family protein [Brachybacterium sp. AG952]|uniref:oligosaccharide flippase family protein n=1 Tax=Brachybacterium sp. AG952 TaxID=2183989 RepID=UPI0024433D4E|nr:oligosaccharide flippase family protein [Brachybacterium sp. AG952]
MVDPEPTAHGDGESRGSSAITRLRRGSAIVFAGSVLGYGISYLVTPLLGRLVTPETFGVFSAVLALASLFTGFSTLRLEVFAASIASSAHQRNARLLALIVAVMISLIILVACAAAWLIADVSPLWLLAAPMVFMGSVQLIATARYSVARAYTTMGVGNFVQGGGTGVAQLALAAMSPTAISLVLGFLLARVHWLLALRGHRANRMPLLGTWRRARSFARSAGVSALLNSTGGQAPVLLMTVMFGTAGAGVFAMAVRLLVGPLAIVAQAVGSTSMGEIGRLASRRDAQLLPTVDSLLRQLALMMAVPCLLAAVFAPSLVTLALGPGWEQTGLVIQVLTLGAFAQAVGSPLTQILNLTHHSKVLMKWDAARLIAIAATFIAVPLAGGGIVLVSLLYSVTMLVLYIAAVILVRSACRRVSLSTS